MVESKYDEFLGRRIALTHKVVHEWADRALAPHEASITDWIVLKSLQRPEAADGVSQRELAGWMGIEPPTVIRHLDRLEGAGLVARRRDDRDRRVVRVTMTAAGRRRFEQLALVMSAADAELRAQLTARELEVLPRALEKLHAYVAADDSAGERERRSAHVAGSR
ncbi:MAG TPA: MarR family transcriptional regulator [Acidimicrobiia bacterium]|nr:MarR family transcriptional regulator [Acidimicrobiia bacterium]